MRDAEKLLHDMRKRVDRPATLVGSSSDVPSDGDSTQTLFPPINLVDIVYTCPLSTKAEENRDSQLGHCCNAAFHAHSKAKAILIEHVEVFPFQ